MVGCFIIGMILTMRWQPSGFLKFSDLTNDISHIEGWMSCVGAKNVAGYPLSCLGYNAPVQLSFLLCGAEFAKLRDRDKMRCANRLVLHKDSGFWSFL